MEYLARLMVTSFSLGLVFLIVTKESLKHGEHLSAFILVCTSTIVLVVGAIAAHKGVKRMKGNE